MAHAAASRKDLIRFIIDEVGWELVEHVRGIRRKEIGVSVPKDLDGIFNINMRKTKGRRETYIPKGAEIEEYISLRRSLRGGSMSEALSIVLYGTVVKSNDRWRKSEKVKGGEAGLSMLVTYTQVDNVLGLRLKYLKAL